MRPHQPVRFYSLQTARLNVSRQFRAGAKLFNQNFIRMNITATISWSTIWSVYPQVDVFEGSGDPFSGDGFWGPGLMYAYVFRSIPRSIVPVLSL